MKLRNICQYFKIVNNKRCTVKLLHCFIAILTYCCTENGKRKMWRKGGEKVFILGLAQNWKVLFIFWMQAKKEKALLFPCPQHPQCKILFFLTLSVFIRVNPCL